jgi:pimeloyl-[acyl-carrier protein] methyl ester esterase
MTLPHILFVHGWAYDANIWGPIRSRLGDPECTVWERGYFEEPGFSLARSEPPPPGPYLAVGHSFGVMRLLRERPEGCIGLVSICGFARFASAEDYRGTPMRILDRMVSRFDAAPGAVVGEFRARCGSQSTRVYALRAERLGEDLAVLRDGDERAAAAALDVPVLSLVGGSDQIVSATMSEASFPQAERAVAPGAGHLLPLRQPEWCAAQITAFARRLGS